MIFAQKNRHLPIAFYIAIILGISNFLPQFSYAFSIDGNKAYPSHLGDSLSYRLGVDSEVRDPLELRDLEFTKQAHPFTMFGFQEKAVWLKFSLQIKLKKV